MTPAGVASADVHHDRELLAAVANADDGIVSHGVGELDVACAIVAWIGKRDSSLAGAG